MIDGVFSSIGQPFMFSHNLLNRFRSGSMLLFLLIDVSLKMTSVLLFKNFIRSLSGIAAVVCK